MSVIDRLIVKITSLYHSLFDSVATEQEIEEYFYQQEIARLKDELEGAQENAEYWQVRAEALEADIRGRSCCPNCGSWIDI